MMTALHSLLHGCIDYAGLFPPAALPLPDVVANYAAYRSGPDAWALGRLIVPAARLAELRAAAASSGGNSEAAPWPVSALLGDDVGFDLALVSAHTAAAPHLLVDAVELKAGSAAAVRAALGLVPADLRAFVEIPVGADPAPLLAAIRDHGAAAKIRTGGTTADAVPSGADLLRFLAAFAAAELPFKATAGLHHPLRSEQPLTYAKDSPRGTMWGFLNVLLATALLAAGGAERDAATLLEERDRTALRFAADHVAWRGQVLDGAAIERGRALCLSFGSCSFEEPLADLKAMDLL